MPKTQIFVDTNVIFEAFRLNCWTAICHNYIIETVEKCIEESLTGNSNPSHKNHIHIDRSILMNGLATSHKPSKKDIANLVLDYPNCQGLDDGELHLFAWLYRHEYHPEILISTADKAAIVSAAQIGWLDSIISLEQIIQKSGISKQQRINLGLQHRSDWLNEIKLKIRLDIL